MRFVGAMVVILVIFSLVGVTQSMLGAWTAGAAAEHPPGHTSPASNAPTGSAPGYRLRLTATFDAERDSFALRSDSGSPPVRLQVKAGDRILYSRTEDWRRGDPLTLGVMNLPGTRIAIFVMATPSEAEMQKACGVRVEVLREDGVVCDDQTLWAEAGTVISTAAMFSLQPAKGHPGGGGEERAHE